MTSSGLGRMSTWQLGVKHSITKRVIPAPRREVRLCAVANPRRVPEPAQALSVQVERWLRGWSRRETALFGSWLKRVGCVRGNQSWRGGACAAYDVGPPGVPAACAAYDRACRAPLARPVRAGSQRHPGPLRGRHPERAGVRLVRGRRAVGAGVVPSVPVPPFRPALPRTNMPVQPIPGTTACTAQRSLPYRRRLVHAPWDPHGNVPGICAGEGFRRTLSGMGLGR